MKEPAPDNLLADGWTRKASSPVFSQWPKQWWKRCEGEAWKGVKNAIFDRA